MASILVTITLLFGGTIPRADDYVNLRLAGLAEYEVGHYAGAEEFIRKALDLAETINNEYEVALSYWHWATSNKRRGNSRTPSGTIEKPSLC